MNQKDIEQFEREAERASDAMYAAERPKDLYEDAMRAFQKAIDLAGKSGLKEQAVRLAARRDQVRSAYERRST
jgi:hypothetical protein